MQKQEFIEMILKALFGPREPDANRHHYLFGVEMASLAERRGEAAPVKRQKGQTFSQWVRDDLRRQCRESYMKDL